MSVWFQSLHISLPDFPPFQTSHWDRIVHYHCPTCLTVNINITSSPKWGILQCTCIIAADFNVIQVPKFCPQQPCCLHHSLVFMESSTCCQWLQDKKDLIWSWGSIWWISTIYKHCCHLKVGRYLINWRKKVKRGPVLWYGLRQFAVFITLYITACLTGVIPKKSSLKIENLFDDDKLSTGYSTW